MSDTIRDILTANKLDKIDFAEAEQAINEYIAQQVKEARIDELMRATNAHTDYLNNKTTFSSYFDKRREELTNE